MGNAGFISSTVVNFGFLGSEVNLIWRSGFDFLVALGRGRAWYSGSGVEALG